MALRQELNLHVMWARGPYTKGAVQNEWWKSNYKGMVFRLSTVATDSAITNGPDLFLNPQLLVAVVEYRQAVAHLNQLIDQAMSFQAHTELYRHWPSRHFKQRMIELLDKVHYDGIGDAKQEVVHFHYVKLDKELRCEESLRLRVFFWVLIGLHRSPHGEC
ncbi:MAG TPA: hypothetical protein VK256_13250 [Candidatus Eisenbacteria bacterium]|nr:hypothetical protein [Candidatus Eisenbacteria bacterium]